MYIVVSYDIEDDKRRGRIHRILKSFGQWMQYSVFECDLTRAQYLVLRHRLDDYIKKAEGDSVRFYFLCEDCEGIQLNKLNTCCIKAKGWTETCVGHRQSLTGLHETYR
jgi:CRISPR-associated protein Cas2